MKPKCTRPRKPAVITNSRWLAYATAGAASTFTGANSAEATIHYSGRIDLNFGIRFPQSVHFQLDQPGDSFLLKHSDDFSGRRSYQGYAHFGVLGPAGASFAGFFNTYNPCPSAHVFLVSKLNGGQLISRRPFTAQNSGLIAGFAPYCTSQYIGQFDYGDVGFIGFRFNNGTGNQYGWVRIKMREGFRIYRAFWLVDYAYADPGEPIRAGQTSSNGMVPEEGNDVVPQEGSLGALALGAVGLLAWRKRQSQAAR